MAIKANYSLEVVRYSIPSDQYRNFEQAYEHASKHLQESEHCVGFEVFKGSEEPDHYIVHIKWTSIEDHLNGFRKSVSFPPFFQLVKPFYNNILEMKHYELTDTFWSKN